ncbi:hypothetical protein MLD38_013163 [Melastoma candidum]|uniref:Uncharacterized protein n=1 Tax=Melastoma candidum TaxID=119954 RepID=A0ACB9R9A9_9MYRT|nr:hypothetical protein MLD38_013163 [Melastoma candidum]
MSHPPTTSLVFYIWVSRRGLPILPVRVLNFPSAPASDGAGCNFSLALIAYKVLEQMPLVLLPIPLNVGLECSGWLRSVNFLVPFL